jgi:hypothetical protein
MLQVTRGAFAAAACALALSGCMTMTPANYMVSQESKAALAKYAGSKVIVTQVASPATFDRMCRAVGNVEIADKMDIGHFVAKGFNDELKFAGIYADNGVKLTGAVTKAAFSSSAALVNGWWDLGLTLQSSNGQSMSIESRHEFESGFVGASACNNTSMALGPAVQQLVQKTVSDPRFATLLK